MGVLYVNEEARITEIEGRDDGRARLHGGANESLSARKLDHFLIGLVHVHSRDSVNDDGAGTLVQRLAEIGVGRRDTARPLENGGVERDHERAARGERVE